MITVKIHFLFTLKGGGTMECTSIGTSDVAEILAISDAWLNLAKDEFDRNIIAQVSSIRVLTTEIELTIT